MEERGSKRGRQTEIGRKRWGRERERQRKSEGRREMEEERWRKR